MLISKLIRSSLFFLLAIVFCGFSTVFTAQSVKAAPPVLVIGLNVTHIDSSPITNGTYTMSFTLFDDPSLGTESDGVHDKWHEIDKTVEVLDGGILIALGSLTPLPDPSLISNYFLAYEFEAEGYNPVRTEMATAQYSYGSGQVDGLSSSQLTQLAQGLQTDSSNTQTTIAINKTGAADILNLQRSGSSVASIDTNGDTLFRPYSNSASGFMLQNANPLPDTLLRADSLANVIKIGNDTASSATDTTLFVVDSSISLYAPAGVNGGIYYNATDDRFMCFEDTAWRHCVSNLQDAYDVSQTADITLVNAKDFTITATDTATDSNILFDLTCVTCSANGGRFAVQRNGNDLVTINPDGSINRVLLAGKALTTQMETGSSMQYIASSVPDTDMLQITNAGHPITDGNVNAISIDYHGGPGVLEASGMRLDFTPGSTAGSVWNGLKLSSQSGAATGVDTFGLVLEGPGTPGTGNETAIKITTGWDIGLDVGSGGLQLAAMDNPAAPIADNLKVYAKKISGRMMLKAMGPSGVDYPLQPSLFQNQVTMINAQSGTANSLFGTNRTLTGTASHPGADETFGYMTNYATAASTNSDAGVSNNSNQFFRGSTSGANGYFFNTRIGLPDASYTNTRIYIGMTSQTTVNSLGSDDPNGHRSGFTYSTTRGDTGWRFTTRDGTTESLSSTVLSFIAGKVYDIYIYVPPQGTTIYYRIDNITDSTSAEGSATTNLPDGNTAMRGSVGITTTNAVSRNIRMQRMYIEADR